MRGLSFSSLQGKALIPREYPTLSDVKSILPADTFKKSTALSLTFAAFDVFITALSGFLGIKYLLPIAFQLWASTSLVSKLSGFGLWSLYSAIVGTCGIAMWVTAHECGHGAFSDNRKLQDFVGYLFHSVWLVPYYSWQRSHAVHHANTNHVVDGETHVPPIKHSPSTHVTGKTYLQRFLGNGFGEFLFGFGQTAAHLLLGWPAYLIGGATGGYSRGVTNHFLPIQFRRPPILGLPELEGKPLKDLFPGSWKSKVLFSDIGVIAMGAVLATLAQKVGWSWILAAYGGPYLMVNAWLVGYTWLQHTDVDIPHLPADGYSFMKGAFLTVDRPYPKMLWGIVDFLHHHIGSTHGKYLPLLLLLC
jgi:fatty acid desaturase